MAETAERDRGASPEDSARGTADREAADAFVDDGYRGRARAERNREALEYYRSRSRAPGVAEGGAERNFYCMECDGVIPFEQVNGACPHCGESLAESARRYFNWVELDQPTSGDAGPILRLAGLVVVIAAGAAALAWWLLVRGPA